MWCRPKRNCAAPRRRRSTWVCSALSSIDPDLSSNDRVAEIELMQMVPVVSMVLGSVAGLPAVQAAMCHFNIMVKDTTQVFVAGPAVVKASQGIMASGFGLKSKARRLSSPSRGLMQK